MVLRIFVALIFSLCCTSTVLAKKNFWDNEYCHSDKDCTGLTYCHRTFGCEVSGGKVAILTFSVIFGLILFCCISVCVCIRCSQRRPFVPPTVAPSGHNNYLSQSVVDINPSANQHRMNNLCTNTANRQPCYPQQPYPTMSRNNLASPLSLPVAKDTNPTEISNMASAPPCPIKNQNYATLGTCDASPPPYSTVNMNTSS